MVFHSIPTILPPFSTMFFHAFPAPFLPSLPRGHSTCDPRWRRRLRWERPGQSTHKSACTRRRKTPGLQCNPWWILDAVNPGLINPKRLVWIGRVPFKYQIHWNPGIRLWLLEEYPPKDSHEMDGMGDDLKMTMVTMVTMVTMLVTV